MSHAMRQLRRARGLTGAGRFSAPSLVSARLAIVGGRGASGAAAARQHPKAVTLGTVGLLLVACSVFDARGILGDWYAPSATCKKFLRLRRHLTQEACFAYSFQVLLICLCTYIYM